MRNGVAGRGRGEGPARLFGVILAGTGLLFLNAWSHIQAVRLGYRASRLQTDLTEIRQSLEGLEQERSRISSLSRLEEWALSRRRTQLPGPGQLFILHDQN